MNSWRIFRKKKYAGQSFLHQSGQVVVEYVLLLVIAVGLSIILTRGLVSRNEESPGLLVKKWRDIVEVIAADKPDAPSN